jgi:hypothetical protein
MCLHQALKPQLALDGTQADPLINRYNDKTIAKLVKGMNLRQEVCEACFYYSNFVLQKPIVILYYRNIL